jgi:hypothetical protein
VGPDCLVDSRRELLPLMRSLWAYVCHVVRFYLTRSKLVRISMTLSEMSDTCLLQSFSSNSIFIMLILILRMMLTTL